MSRWAVHHPVRALIAWALLLLVIGLGASRFAGSFNDTFALPGASSTTAEDMLAKLAGTPTRHVEHQGRVVLPGRVRHLRRHQARDRAHAQGARRPGVHPVRRRSVRTELRHRLPRGHAGRPEEGGQAGRPRRAGQEDRHPRGQAGRSGRRSGVAGPAREVRPREARGDRPRPARDRPARLGPPPRPRRPRGHHARRPVVRGRARRRRHPGRARRHRRPRRPRQPPRAAAHGDRQGVARTRAPDPGVEAHARRPGEAHPGRPVVPRRHQSRPRSRP